MICHFNSASDVCAIKDYLLTHLPSPVFDVSVEIDRTGISGAEKLEFLSYQLVLVA